MQDRKFLICLVTLALFAVLVSTACATAPAPVPTEPPKPAATAAPATAAPKPTEAPKAAASTWPTKDVTFIIPFGPGGGFDLQARIFLSLWPKYMPKKVNVVANNQSGAGGNIGSIALMKTAPDGLSVAILSPATLALAQMNNQLEGQDITKITWLGQVSWDPGVVVVSTASALKTPKDLTSREIRIGLTTDSIFANLLLAKKLGIKNQRVMFDSSPEQTLAAMRGDVDMMMDSWTTMKKSVDNSEGKLTPLFVVSDTRLPGWPTVPTSKELGLDLGDLQAIAGAARLIGGPAGIPAETAKAMQDSAWSALQDPEFKAGMQKAGYDATFVANSADAAKTVATILKVLQDNKDVLDALKK